MRFLDQLQTSNSEGSRQGARPKEAPPDPSSSIDRTKQKGCRSVYVLFVPRS